MADIPNDPNPARRAELNAALAVVNPQIRGLQDLSVTSISAELKAQIALQVDARSRRVTLINAELAALDTAVQAMNNLEADGYPDLPATPIIGSLFEELHEENADLTAALAVFASEQITAGPMTMTANPNPPAAAGP